MSLVVLEMNISIHDSIVVWRVLFQVRNCYIIIFQILHATALFDLGWKKVTVMVHYSTNLYKMNNHLSPQLIEHKKDHNI